MCWASRHAPYDRNVVLEATSRAIVVELIVIDSAQMYEQTKKQMVVMVVMELSAGRSRVRE